MAEGRYSWSNPWVRRAVVAVVAVAVALLLQATLGRKTEPPPVGTRPAITAIDPRVQAAKALATGQVANFILYDAPEPAPVIAFAEEAGTPRTLADFRGKTVLVNFWATWCGPCKREMPSLDRLQAKLGSDRFQVLPISQDRVGVQQVRAYYDEQKIAALQLYIDKSGDSQRAFAVKGLPSTVLIDTQGRVVGRMVGPTEWDSPEAMALLQHFAER